MKKENLMKRLALWAAVAALFALPVLRAAEANYTAGGGTIGGGVEHAIAIGTSGDVATVTGDVYSDYGIAIGANASLDHAPSGIAIGNGAVIGGGSFGVAIGARASILGAKNAVAIGIEATAGQLSVSIGEYTKTDEAAVAIGSRAEATGASSIAIGVSSVASDGGSTAVGRWANAGAVEATALGIEANAAGAFSFAAGSYTLASGDKSIAIGSNYDDSNSIRTEATGLWSVAVGNAAQATAADALALGSSANATADYATALGANASASGQYSIAIGSADASEENAIAIGNGAKAVGANSSTRGSSVAIGVNAQATGIHSSAYGSGAVASGYQSSAYGSGAVASGINSSAYGGSEAIGEHSSTYGRAANAYGKYGSAYGTYATATGESSSAYGDTAEAAGNYSSAYGAYATATGESSTAYGYYARATVAYGVALGAWSVADRMTTAAGVYVPTGADAGGVNATVNGSGIGVVSIGGTQGSIEFTRQLTGVAAGVTSTDAVNVAQLAALDGVVVSQDALIAGNTSAINAVSSDVAMAVKYDAGKKSVTLGNGTDMVTLKNVAAGVTSNDAVNFEQLSATELKVAAVSGDVSTLGGRVSANETAITSHDARIAANERGIVTLNTAVASHDTLIAGNTSAINAVSADVAMAVKYDDGKKSVTLGNGIDMVTLKNVAAGVTSNDAVNFEQLSATELKVAAVSGDVSTLGGRVSANETAITSHDARIAANERGIVTLNTAVASHDTLIAGNTSAINTVSADVAMAVKYDAGKKSVTLGNGTDMVTLKNVAAGVTSNDAVNFAQLSATELKVAAVSGDVSALGGRVTANETAITSHDTRIAANERGIVTLNTAVASHDTLIAGNTSAINAVSADVAMAVKYDDGTKTSVKLGDGVNPVKLTNLAAGEIARDSKDAVTGGQLYTVSADINTRIDNIVTSGDARAVRYDDDAKTSVTLGNSATPVRLRNVAAGVTSNDAVNFAQLSATELKVAAVSGDVSTLGGRVTANTLNIGRVSDDLRTLDDRAVKYNDAKTEVALGGIGTPVKLTNVADGTIAAGSREAVTGGQLYTVSADINTRIDNIVTSGDARAVRYDDDAKTSVTLGNSATPVRLRNVAAGVTSNDAVNFEQLSATELKVAAVSGDVSVLGGRVSANETAIASHDARIAANESGIVTLNTAVASHDTLIAGNTAAINAVSTDVAMSVKYDDGAKTSVSLGDGMKPVKLTNLAAGEIARDSKDAVTGGQLFATNERVAANEASIGAVSSDVAMSVKYASGSANRLTLTDGSGGAVKISNVAEGKVAADSREAVTGAQLFATNQSVAAVSGDVSTLKVSVDSNTANINTLTNSLDTVSGDVSALGGRVAVNETNIGAISSDMAMAVKYASGSSNKLVLADGDGGTVKISNVADGRDDTDAVNYRQLKGVSDDLSQKIDDIAVTGDPRAVRYDVAGGSVITLGGAGHAPVKITNVARGTEDGDAVNYGQYKELDGKLDTLGTTLAERTGGSYDSVSGSFDITYPPSPMPSTGQNTQNSSGAVQNSGDPHLNDTLQSMWDAIGSIQGGSVTAGDNIVVEGNKVSVSKNPEFERVKVGAIDIGGGGIDMGGGKITGLSNGDLYQGSTDAVTGDQLWNAYRRIDTIDERVQVVGAHAAALSAMHPVAYNPYEPTTISAGVGYYRSEQSLAVGVFHYIRENVLVNAGVAFNSDGDTMGRAGISFSVGGHKGGKQASVYKDMTEMQRQMAAMREMLMQLKDENDKNRETIKELKEALKDKN
ncbi:YadA-like family protein [Cloacibacillus porcorum]|uniref:YadA-like family protein n=1 Tax=Cloacibacillus porcorum TaxID=1197717 RepID=UPI003F0FB47D